MANRIILVGNFGGEPEIKTTQSGMKVANISLATNDRRKDKDGNPVDNTQWHRLVFFGKLAELVAQYPRKGGRAYIEGTVRYSTYEKDGVKMYFTDIIVNDVEFLTSKPDAAGADVPASSTPPAPATPAVDFTDDDIPF